MKYWVFDLDGTLIDSFGHFFETIQPHIPELFTHEDRLRAVSNTAEVFLSKWLTTERIEEVLAELRQSSLDHSHLVPRYTGTAEAFKILKANGCRVAIYTNRDFKTAKAIVDAAGWQDTVEILVSGDCVAKRKPHVEGLEKIQRHFGCSAENMVMIGDHHVDVEMAKTHGAFAVRASWHEHWDHDNCKVADKQFYSHDEFAKWVAEVTK